MESSAMSDWVVEIERYISGDIALNPWHSIYRVPEYIKNMTNPNAYRPRVVSLGPFHHDDPALMPMEKHKDRAVANLVKRSGKPMQEFIAAVEEIKEQLQDAYENLDDKWRHGTRFVELMLKDGCFLLEMARVFGWTVQDFEPADDPVFSKHGRLYLYSGITSDVVLMENQLPLVLLQELMRIAYPDVFQDNEGRLNNWVLWFLCSIVTIPTIVDDHLELGLHPLDVLHKSMTGTRRHRQRPIASFPLMPCAAELHEAGIHFKLSEAKGFGGGVTFEGGVLNIPKIFWDDDAERIFLNLMAFERLHPSAGNDVTAFVIFMDLLIDTAKDVALLRSEEIIENASGSDKAVADLINETLTKGAVVSEDCSLIDVLSDVTAYYKKPWNRLRASFIHNYFSNPWVFISLVAAVILLVATVMQTVYTIVPFYKNK